MIVYIVYIWIPKANSSSTVRNIDHLLPSSYRRTQLTGSIESQRVLRIEGVLAALSASRLSPSSLILAGRVPRWGWSPSRHRDQALRNRRRRSLPHFLRNKWNILDSLCFCANGAIVVASVIFVSFYRYCDCAAHRTFVATCIYIRPANLITDATWIVRIRIGLNNEAITWNDLN